MNILDPFRRFLFTHLDFCAFSVEKCNATVKTISCKMEAISCGYHCPDGNTDEKKDCQNISKPITNIVEIL